MTIPMIGVLDGHGADTRETDPHTSHEARDGITPEGLAESQQEVLAILRLYGPMDAAVLVEQHELRAGFGHTLWHLSDSRLRTAVKELADAGRIVCVRTVRRSTRPGGRETRHRVWAVTPTSDLTGETP